MFTGTGENSLAPDTKIKYNGCKAPVILYFHFILGRSVLLEKGCGAEPAEGRERSFIWHF